MGQICESSSWDPIWQIQHDDLEEITWDGQQLFEDKTNNVVIEPEPLSTLQCALETPI
jgi:hypothetical protein